MDVALNHEFGGNHMADVTRNGALHAADPAKLLEATAHFRPAYPELVRKSEEHNVVAFFRNWWTYMRFAVAPEGVDYFSYRAAMQGAYQQPKAKAQ